MQKQLLIVDDEKNIRQGLQVMIERQYPGKYEIRTAIHGQEALDMHRQQPAHIILTDIRMPGMDGFQLMEQLSQEETGERPTLVILSGYDEFEYAKTAIRYQVVEYLLKPIRREELYAVLERIEEESQSRIRIKQQLAESEKFRRELRSSRLQLLLGGGELSAPELTAIGQQIGFPDYKLPFQVVVLTYIREDEGWMKRDELRLLGDKLVKEAGADYEAGVLDAQGRMVWITSQPQAFQTAAEQAEAKGLGGVVMGISSEGHALPDIYRCYEEARTAQKYVFTLSHGNYVRYESIQERNRQEEPIPAEDIRKLGNLLGWKPEEEIKDHLQAIFKTNQLPQISISYLERVSREINERVLDEVFRIYGEASIELLKMYRRVGSLYNFRHFHAYYRTLEHLLICLNDYIRQISSVHSGQADMRKAFAYIEENYHRMLNMAMVSNYVSLNYSYFSEAFKAAAGESFVNYLKKVRIRHAKDKMNNSSLKLTEISRIVGFESTKQFTRVFKEIEGITPQEYRAKLAVSVQVQKD
ncbi:response regulator [Paenibacillus tuaregi]|uniref:response regulator n=1 Tax=Paenibacillus tuaregi TaxID=1816681 RepID=UPI0008381AC5|nr:response regulator [Paenibacillus tuaregi]